LDGGVLAELIDSKYLIHAFEDKGLGYISSNFEVPSPMLYFGTWCANENVPMGQNGPAWYGAKWA
jgi:hypothetical protein